MVLPDRLYLWKDAGNTPELVEPTFEIDAAPIFRPYFESAGISPEAITALSFELPVVWWLNELTWYSGPISLPEPQRQVLQESGLLEALKGGQIVIRERA
jgi:hypothetical protein